MHGIECTPPLTGSVPPGDGGRDEELRISSRSRRSPELRNGSRTHHGSKTASDDNTRPTDAKCKSGSRHNHNRTSTGGTYGFASILAEAKVDEEAKADKAERDAKGGAGRGLALLGDLPSLGSKMVSRKNVTLSSLGLSLHSDGSELCGDHAGCCPAHQFLLNVVF